jgi:ATP-dependent Clp protease ATP-binding subunit ClpX
MAWRACQLRVLTRSLRTQARYAYVPREDLGGPSSIRSAGVATPRQVFTQSISGPDLRSSRLLAIHSLFNTSMNSSSGRRTLRRCSRSREYLSSVGLGEMLLSAKDARVFNHYIRVRANLSTESEQDDVDRSADTPAEDGTSPCCIFFRRLG